MLKKIKAALAAMALLMSLNASALQVDTLEVESTYLPTPMKVTIMRPELADSVKYPVVYMLNGYGGCYKDWAERAPVTKDLAERYKMILVCPDGRDSWYFDSPVDSGLKMESFITKTLVDAIDRLYPTDARPERRAITGLSMGGHGAMWLGLRHPDLFGAIGSMSGGLDFTPFPEKWKIAERLGPYEGNEELWQSHTAISLIPGLETKQPITIDCGIDDFFASVNDKMHAALVEAKIPHDYTSRPGRHSWAYWRNSIIYHLTFFNEFFNTPTAD